MKTLCLLLLLLIPFLRAASQSQIDIDKQELKSLLDERKQKFDSYAVSLEKHSGIFGNKTKNDIRKSQAVLVDIIKTDNRIISNLYRVVDFRSYEKVNMTYSDQKKDETVNNLKHAADTLSKQVDVLKASNYDLQIRVIKWKWLFYIFAAILSYLIYRSWRRARAAKDLPGSRVE